MSGKEIRLKHLFKHGERLLIVPMDHGITIGPVNGLADIEATIKAVSKGGADAVILHQGLAQGIGKSQGIGESQGIGKSQGIGESQGDGDLFGPGGCELILHLSASTSLAPDSSRKEIVASVERALELGATAVSIHVNLGAAFEAEMIADFGLISAQCCRWGMPLLAMMYVRDGSRESEFDPIKIRHAARVAEELGADLIKVNYTGDPESFATVVEGVKTPVMIAGGPRMGSTAELLEMVVGAITAGAKGAAIGRNIFQDRNPELLVKTIRQTLGQTSFGKLVPKGRSR